MEVKFANYRFITDQYILLKNDKIIPLKRNQELLLNYFLFNPDKIHSKDDILDSVWKNKVVSEQVVFQTISQLRSLLGDQAIKTFPKKGYKWQLTIDSTNLKKTSFTVENTASSSMLNNRKSFVMWLLIFLSLFILSVLIYTNHYTKINKTSLHILLNENKSSSSQQQFIDLANSAIAKNTAFKVNQTVLESSVRQAFSAPKLIWQQAQLDNSDWIFWGDTYSSEKGLFLNYGLSRKDIHWQGYLFAENAQLLEQALANRLSQLQTIGLFSETINVLDINTLNSMKLLDPDDPDLLLLLAKHYIQIKHLDVALTHLQRLQNLNSSYAFRPYQAQAQMSMGKIYKIRSQHIQSNNSLEAMSDILVDTPLWPLNFHNIKIKAWLAHDRGDFDKMFNILEKGLAFGQKQADPLTLFELHILYSILAKKASDESKKYLHLNAAQSILIKHKLDDSNLAVVYFHFALFTEDSHRAIPYLELILTLPRTGQNYWIQDDALEMLVDFHIERQEYTIAHSQLEKNPKSAKKLVLLGKIYLAERKPDMALPLLKKAFELSRLAYDSGTGIQAALKLYHLTESQPKDRAEYLAYLESHAKPDWLKQQGIVPVSHLE